MSKPDFLLTLRAVNLGAQRSVAATGNINDTVYEGPSVVSVFEIPARDEKEKTPMEVDDSEGPPRIELRFSNVKDHKKGFVFGSDPDTCDVYLGRHKYGFSKHHFRITYDEQRRLIVRDESRIGTALAYLVNQTFQCASDVRKNFTWLILPQAHGHEIRIGNLQKHPHASIQFEINLVDHHGQEPEFRLLQYAFTEEVDLARPHEQNNSSTMCQTTATTTNVAPSGAASPKSWHSPAYFKEKLLGSGTFGSVWKAIDVSTGDRVAQKLILNHHCDYENEVHILKQLSHDHVVKFISFDKDASPPSYAMELVEHGDLSSYRVKSSCQVHRILTQSLSALKYLNEKGIVHRDIKPNNILLDQLEPLRVKICDFGLAKQADAFHTLPGSWRYAAPEYHQKGLAKDAAVDVWSVAVVILELVVPLPPYMDGLSEYWSNMLVTSASRFKDDEIIRMVLLFMLVEDPRKRHNARKCLEAIENTWTEEDTMGDYAVPLGQDLERGTTEENEEQEESSRPRTPRLRLKDARRTVEALNQSDPQSDGSIIMASDGAKAPASNRNTTIPRRGDDLGRMSRVLRRFKERPNQIQPWLERSRRHTFIMRMSQMEKPERKGKTQDEPGADFRHAEPSPRHISGRHEPHDPAMPSEESWVSTEVAPEEERHKKPSPILDQPWELNLHHQASDYVRCRSNVSEASTEIACVGESRGPVLPTIEHLDTVGNHLLDRQYLGRGSNTSNAPPEVAPKPNQHEDVIPTAGLRNFSEPMADAMEEHLNFDDLPLRGHSVECMSDGERLPDTVPNSLMAPAGASLNALGNSVSSAIDQDQPNTEFSGKVVDTLASSSLSSALT